MQPNLQIDFQIISNEQGNKAISPKGSSLKGKNEFKGEGEGFLGMLGKIERIPDGNKTDLLKLQGKGLSDENILSMVVKTDPGTCLPINDLTLKEGNGINLLNPNTIAQEFLTGEVSNNEKAIRFFGYFGVTETENGAEKGSIDKNNLIATSKTESDSTLKKSALGEMINLSGKSEEIESKTGQGESNKIDSQIQIPKEFGGNVGKETRIQTSKAIKEAGIEISKGSKQGVGKEAEIEITKGLEGAAEKEAGVLISKEPKGTVGKETGAQLLKGLETDIVKAIKNLATKGDTAKGPINHAVDLKNVEKTALTNKILMETATARTVVEESKIVNHPQLFNDELRDSELNKKDLSLKISSDIKGKDQGSDSLQKDHTSDKEASKQDKEFINLKETALKAKASGSEFSAAKMVGMETESKGNGVILPKNVSGDKSFEEILFDRENRSSSNISRAGTLNQIVEKAALILKDGKSHARVELKPDFLGSVRMKITTENHLVRVRILTELPVVKEMIENNISQLKTDLQNHGLTIDKLDVFVANDSQQHGKGFEKAELLSENENSDISDNGSVGDEETETVNLLKDDTTADGLDFFA